MDAEKVLNATCEAGEILLVSGAEIYRVEETMVRICNAYHVENANSFVTMSGIFMSFDLNHHTYSKVCRVKSSALNLERINAVNQVSRDVSLHNIDIDEFLSRLAEIKQFPTHDPVHERIVSGITAGAFCVFFQGTLVSCIAACLIGFVVKWVQQHFMRLQINSFICIGFCSACTVFLANLIVTLVPTTNLDAIITGVIMLLVPGLAITNAIRDFIAGDYLSGMTRATEAFLISISLAVGAGIITSFIYALQGGF